MEASTKTNLGIIIALIGIMLLVQSLSVKSAEITNLLLLSIVLTIVGAFMALARKRK